MKEIRLKIDRHNKDLQINKYFGNALNMQINLDSKFY
jgi:hypothetical protein